jgi:hypothetical protein
MAARESPAPARTVATLQAAADLLRREGAAVLARASLSALAPGRAWSELAEAWEGLPLDEHLPRGASFRFRRFGRLAARPMDDGYRLEPLPSAPFRQSAELIPLYGGKAREFAPIHARTLSAPALHALVDHDLELVTMAEGRRPPCQVGLHMVRVIAASDEQVAPAPEGRHRDGHSYIAMHLIGRRNCTGGISRVYEGRAPQPCLVTTMREPLDTVVIDDCRVEHEVSPIQSTLGRGERDILLVDIDLE